MEEIKLAAMANFEHENRDESLLIVLIGASDYRVLDAGKKFEISILKLFATSWKL